MSGTVVGQGAQRLPEGVVPTLELRQLLEEPDGFLASKGELVGGHGGHGVGEDDEFVSALHPLDRTPVRQATQADQVASLAEDGARASGWPLSVPWLRLSRQVAELRTLIEGFGDLVSVLDKANPKERAKVYADLG